MAFHNRFQNYNINLFLLLSWSLCWPCMTFPVGFQVIPLSGCICLGNTLTEILRVLIFIVLSLIFVCIFSRWIFSLSFSFFGFHSILMHLLWMVLYANLCKFGFIWEKKKFIQHYKFCNFLIFEIIPMHLLHTVDLVCYANNSLIRSIVWNLYSR